MLTIDAFAAPPASAVGAVVTHVGTPAVADDADLRWHQKTMGETKKEVSLLDYARALLFGAGPYSLL